LVAGTDKNSGHGPFGGDAASYPAATCSRAGYLATATGRPARPLLLTRPLLPGVLLRARPLRLI